MDEKREQDQVTAVYTKQIARSAGNTWEEYQNLVLSSLETQAGTLRELSRNIREMELGRAREKVEADAWKRQFEREQQEFKTALQQLRTDVKPAMDDLGNRKILEGAGKTRLVLIGAILGGIPGWLVLVFEVINLIHPK